MFSSNASQVSNDVNYIEDVFSTYLYTGTGAAQTITNGIDLAGKGGLVWIKSRSAVVNHTLWDTSRGVRNYLSSNNTDANTDFSGTSYGLSAFNANGFALGLSANGENSNGSSLCSWTFRKQPKFFDVVTYAGAGNADYSHALESVPGFVIYKSTSDNGNWNCMCRKSNGTYELLQLNTTASTFSTFANASAAGLTSTTFNPSFAGNATPGTQFIAYLFAHDAGGFGLSGNENVISCGSYTGTYTVDLGYEPQFLLTRRVSGTAGGNQWNMYDTMRGWSLDNTNTSQLRILDPSLQTAETGSATTNWKINSQGFSGAVSSDTYIYIAIRRGPMKVPTLGTSVFEPSAVSLSTGSQVSTGFPVDMQISRTGRRTDVAYEMISDRLRGVSTTATNSGARLWTGATSAEASDVWTRNWNSTGFQIPTALGGLSATYQSFRRAPSFFDQVLYNGDLSEDRYLNHNLKAIPELVITRARDRSDAWYVYHKAVGNGKTLYLYTAGVPDVNVNHWKNPHTASLLALGYYQNSYSGNSYSAYLFATCAGVSKVGSYTGNGGSQTINCGFTAGARFVMIKQTSGAGGDWFVFDSARGIVGGVDPWLALNRTLAEQASDDAVDAAGVGFIVNQSIDVNLSGETYIFLAVA